MSPKVSSSEGTNSPTQKKNMKRRKFSKHTWTAEEDSILAGAIEKYGEKSWTKIASLLEGRVGKQCRDRWCNHLRPAVKKGNWTEEEDQLLFEAHSKFGNQWAEIARHILPGRTDLSVKNRYYSTLRRADRKQARAERVRVRDSLAQKRKRTKTNESETSELSDEEKQCLGSQKANVRNVSPSNSPTNRSASIPGFKGLKAENQSFSKKMKGDNTMSLKTKTSESLNTATDSQMQQSINYSQLVQQQSLANALTNNWATMNALAGNVGGSFPSVGSGFLPQGFLASSKLNAESDPVTKDIKGETDTRKSTNPESQNPDISANVAMTLFQLQNNLNPQLLAVQQFMQHQQSQQLQLAAALQQGNLDNKLMENKATQTPIPTAYANGRAVSGAYPGTENTGRWSHEEHSKFLEGMKLYGNKNWTCIADVVKTRTVVQVRTHAQKYFKKLRKQQLEKGESGQTESVSSDAVETNVEEFSDQEKTTSIDPNINSVNAASMLLALQQA